MDLHLDLDRGLGRRRSLEEALRTAIRAGSLHPGTRLPSSRTLAADLGLARATVVAAYEQLVAEGYLTSRHGSGTRVAVEGGTAAPDGPGGMSSLPPPSSSTPRPGGGPATDFLPGEPDLSLFPRSGWATSVRAALREVPASTLGYGDPRGLRALRESLAAYLGRARAVVADPDRIFVFSGFSDALAALAAVLAVSDGRPVAVEDPSLPPHRGILQRAGVRLLPVPVDDEGLDVDHLSRTGAGAVLVTPAHQYPTGVTLSARRRGRLLDWAGDAEGWVVEDDYDGEFRYDRQPVGSLQGLGPQRVVYAGTASKSIAPGVGIGWLVVPGPLVEPLVEHVRLRVTTSTIEQAALARFVDSGGLDRHLRRMRTVYRRRRDRLLTLLAAEAPGIPCGGVAAGLHLTVDLASSEQERALVRHAGAASLALLGLGWHHAGEAGRAGIVLGYSRSPEHAYPAALRRLRDVLRSDRDLLAAPTEPVR